MGASQKKVGRFNVHRVIIDGDNVTGYTSKGIVTLRGLHEKSIEIVADRTERLGVTPCIGRVEDDGSITILKVLVYSHVRCAQNRKTKQCKTIKERMEILYPPHSASFKGRNLKSLAKGGSV